MQTQVRKTILTTFKVDLQVLCHPWLLTIIFCLLHPVLVIKWVDFCSKKVMLQRIVTPNQDTAKENSDFYIFPIAKVLRIWY